MLYIAMAVVTVRMATDMVMLVIMTMLLMVIVLLAMRMTFPIHAE